MFQISKELAQSALPWTLRHEGLQAMKDDRARLVVCNFHKSVLRYTWKRVLNETVILSDIPFCNWDNGSVLSYKMYVHTNTISSLLFCLIFLLSTSLPTPQMETWSRCCYCAVVSPRNHYPLSQVGNCFVTMGTPCPATDGGDPIFFD